MANKYTIDLTDQNPNRQFTIQPYTTNGPSFPTDANLASQSADAATTLLLYGKGVPDYGERIAENMVHLLENFAAPSEPVYPTAGQIWYRTDLTPSQLFVYTEAWRQIVSNPSGQGIEYFSIEGDHTSRFVSGFTFRIYDPQNTDSVEQYIVAASSTFNGTKTTFKVTPTPPASRATGDWYIGGWEPVLQNNAPLQQNLDANNYKIVNLQDPTSGKDALNLATADSRYVNITGNETITGSITIQDNLTVSPGSLTVSGDISTSSNISAAGDLSLSSGDITTSGGDIITLGDLSLSGGGITTSGSNLTVTGDLSVGGNQTISGDLTMTGGFLTLDSDPTNPLHAATKQYVESYVNSVAVLTNESNPSLSGDLDMNNNAIINLADPSSSSDAATKAYVDANTLQGVSELDGLSDVQIEPPPLATGQLLIFDASVGNNGRWINTDPPFLYSSGDTMNGTLDMNSNTITNVSITNLSSPSASDDAATKQYVDNQISNASDEASVADTGHTFNSLKGRLTLTRTDNSTFDIPNIFVQSADVSQKVRPFWEFRSFFYTDYLENRLATEGNYPSFRNSELIQRLSEIAGTSRLPNRRAVFVTDGTSTRYATDIDPIPKTEITSVNGFEPVTNYPDSSTVEIANDYTNTFTAGKNLYITGGSNASSSPYTVSSAGSTYDSSNNITTIPIDELLSSTSITTDSVLLPADVLVVSPGTSDSNFAVEAEDTGLQGNEISFEVIEPSSSSNLMVSVSNNQITVNLAHDGNGLTSTANDVVSAINNDTNASSLVRAFVVEGDGTGIVDVNDSQFFSYLENVQLVLSSRSVFLTRSSAPFQAISGPNVGSYNVGPNGATLGTNQTTVPINSFVVNTSGGVVVLPDRNARYVVGQNHLNVYLNGQKMVKNTRGYGTIKHDTDDNTVQGTGFFPAAYTGLAPGTIYSFTITFDNSSSQTVSLDGSNAQTFSELAKTINNINSFNNKGVVLVQNQQLEFYSNTTGDNSRVIIEDVPASGEVSLISNLTGESINNPPAWNSSTNYNVGDQVVLNNVVHVALQPNIGVDPTARPLVWREVQNYTPIIGPLNVGQTYGFAEVGSYGETASAVDFNSPPAQGSTVEVVVNKTQVLYN